MELSDFVPDENCPLVNVHPLVVLSVSDHVTRMDYVAYQRSVEGKNGAATRGSEGNSAFRDEHSLASVLGILLGEYHSSTHSASATSAGTAAVSVVASFEMVLKGATDEIASLPHPPAKRFRDNESEARPADAARAELSYLQEDRLWYVENIDWPAVAAMCEQTCRVHPEMSVVGWYAAGSEIGDVAVCAELNARVAVIAAQDTLRRKQEAEDASAASQKRAQIGTSSGSDAATTSKNVGRPSTTTAATTVAAATAKEANAMDDSEDDNSNNSNNNLLALVLDAHMSDAHAKLPIHIFTVRMSEAATRAAMATTPLSAASDVSALATFHFEPFPSGVVVYEETTTPSSSSSTKPEAEAEEAEAKKKSSLVRTTSFLLTRLRIESEEIEHIGVDAAMNVNLQVRSVQLSDEALAAKGVFSAPTKRDSSRFEISQGELALVRQALQTPADLLPSVARLEQALRVLRRRVQLLLFYLETVERDGMQSVVQDDLTLREIASICARLPCPPPSYPHAHWNDVHAQRESATAPQHHQMIASTGSQDVLPGATRCDHSRQTLNVVEEESERTLVAALLTSQTRLALDMQNMMREKGAIVYALYSAAASYKERKVEEERLAMESRTLGYDGVGAQGRTGQFNSGKRGAFQSYRRQK